MIVRDQSKNYFHLTPKIFPLCQLGFRVMIFREIWNFNLLREHTHKKLLKFGHCLEGGGGEVPGLPKLL